MKLITTVDITNDHMDTDINTVELMDNDASNQVVDATNDKPKHIILTTNAEDHNDPSPRIQTIPSEKHLTIRSTEIPSLDKNNFSQTNLAAILQVTQDNEDETLPEYLELLLEGTGVCGDSRSEYAKPDWLDMDKFRRGQAFQKQYSFGVSYSQMISLMILFAFQGGLEPLIYSGKSHTPFKAFKRYLSTVLRVKSWYEGDIWTDDNIGHRNLKIVRSMHEGIRKRLTTAPKEEVEKKVTLDDGEGKNPMWTTFHGDISEDFKSGCPFSQNPLHGNKQVYVNQTDMAVTQFGFIGLIMLFPKMFGIHSATDADLEGFAHFWRVIGYLLGVEDRFNLCGGDYKEVVKRCQDLLEYWVKPSFFKVNRDWIHMSRCMVEGISYYVPGITFEVVLLYMCTVISVQAPRLAASLKFWQRVMFNYTVFLYAYVLRLPGMYTFHNWLINVAIKRAQAIPPERLRKLEEKVYPYQTQPRMSYTRI